MQDKLLKAAVRAMNRAWLDKDDALDAGLARTPWHMRVHHLEAALRIIAYAYPTNRHAGAKEVLQGVGTRFQQLLVSQLEVAATQHTRPLRSNTLTAVQSAALLALNAPQLAALPAARHAESAASMAAASTTAHAGAQAQWLAEAGPQGETNGAMPAPGPAESAQRVLRVLSHDGEWGLHATPSRQRRGLLLAWVLRQTTRQLALENAGAQRVLSDISWERWAHDSATRVKHHFHLTPLTAAALAVAVCRVRGERVIFGVSLAGQVHCVMPWMQPRSDAADETREQDRVNVGTVLPLVRELEQAGLWFAHTCRLVTESAWELYRERSDEAWLDQECRHALLRSLLSLPDVTVTHGHWDARWVLMLAAACNAAGGDGSAMSDIVRKRCQDWASEGGANSSGVAPGVENGSAVTSASTEGASKPPPFMRTARSWAVRRQTPPRPDHCQAS